MNHSTSQRLFLLLGLVLLGGCCNATVKPYELTVLFDESTYKSLVEPVEIDIVGVNNDTASSYQKELIGPYFRPTPPTPGLRSQLSLGADRITLRFLPSPDGAGMRSFINADVPVNSEVVIKTRIVTIALDHPIWKKWLGERPMCSTKPNWNLLVFPDMRDLNKDGQPKRIPLTLKDWEETKLGDEKAWKQRGLTIEIKNKYVNVNSVDVPPAR